MLPNELKKELRQRLSLIRLAKTGFFKKAEVQHAQVSKELLLHRAVLDKALIDSFSHDTEIREDVEEWLELDNPDFLECCERAMLNPEGVFESFKMFKQILKGKNAKFQGFRTRKDKRDNETTSTE